MSKPERLHENINELADILNKYPFITLQNITEIFPAYYPIVEVEVGYSEKSYENFEVIPKLVLRLINIGIYDTSVIANQLNLTSFYIEGIIKQLLADGQLINSNDVYIISDLGKESLNDLENRIVKNHAGRQILEMDALNADLIRIDQTISDKRLRGSEYLDYFGGIIDARSGVLFDSDNNVILTNSDEYIKHNKEVLSANVETIDEIKYLDTRYVRSFIIILNNEDYLILYKTKYSGSYYIMAINQNALDKYPINNKYSILDDEALNSINNTITRGRMPIKTPKEDEVDEIDYSIILKEELETLYDFNSYDIKINNNQFIITIDKNSINIYDPRLNIILKQFSKNNSFISTTKFLHGKYILINTNDEYLLSLSKKYEKAINIHTEKVIAEALKNYFNMNSDIDILSSIENILDSYIKDGGEE